MSHSKMTKRGRSRYVESANPDAKRFINVCTVCGAQGYRPSIDEEGFVYDDANNLRDPVHRAIRNELKRILRPLPLDALGRCEDCVKMMDKQ